ncbi:Tat pathway signal sequence domain protein [Streptomyces sp. ID05-39B]|uniref:Tat pathway signal sequence domain protein n=1 Tax=Streptomyces sp. ID05-39B TaxID=3028664 RepID=UPI0029AE8A42|nr:Tat pathway signal sequence domain protein [Streptomyces sp. ID05-39B]MDX3532125.1 Tat pathway signal sequence domain protein [Streptomyces sp. ID05-39B]
MRTTVRRHLGKVVAGAAVAVAATAAMIAITLPGTAGAEGTTGGSGEKTAAGQQGSGQAAAGQQGGPAAVAPGVVEQAPAEGERGTGRDPLTDDEIARVERIALSRQLFDASQDVDGDRGPQPLGVDLADPEAEEVDDPSAPRRAEVSFYDYKDDTLVTRTVNLDTGKVEATGSGQGVQPPLSRAENTEAATLLIADPLGAGLRADYKDATGKALTSPDQLQLSSMVYRAVPGAQPAAFDSCGIHRCARLLLKVKNGPWIDTRSLVIDLSTRKVAALTR